LLHAIFFFGSHFAKIMFGVGNMKFILMAFTADFEGRFPSDNLSRASRSNDQQRRYSHSRQAMRNLDMELKAVAAGI
jgi:hypothetical protein